MGLYTAMKTWAAAVLPTTDMNTYVRDNFKAIMESASIGTTLPTSPVDGQLFWYVADASARVVWGLKYNAAGPAGKQWEYVGGSALIAIDDTGTSPPATTLYTDLAPTVQVTVPLQGDYRANYGAGQLATAGTGGLLTAKFGTAAVSDNDAIFCTSTSSGQARWSNTKPLAAGDVVKLQQRSPTSGSITMQGKFLYVFPLRVG